MKIKKLITYILKLIFPNTQYLIFYYFHSLWDFSYFYWYKIYEWMKSCLKYCKYINININFDAKGMVLPFYLEDPIFRIRILSKRKSHYLNKIRLINNQKLI